MKDWLEKHFEEQYSLLKTLAAIPAPSYREERRAAFIADWCEKNGVGPVIVDGVNNVLIPFFEGDAEDIAVYAAHTDVVFPDETALPVREEGGRLYAPGVGDDTANAAAILTALRFIKDRGLKPREPVLFVLNSCEEGLGNLRGTKELFARYAGRIKEFVSFDCDISAGMVTRAVGSERWRVRCETKGGHSYSAFGRPNAIHRMAKLIDALYSQPVPKKEGSRATFNAGTVEGGTSVNTIAQSCEMLYEYRSDDRELLSELRESFLNLLKDADCEDARFSAEPIGVRPCGSAVDPERHEALLERCGAAISAVTGRAVPRCAASTDANIPLSLGVPAVTFGLFSGEGAHTRGEWVDIASIRPGFEIAISLIAGSHFATC